MKKRRGISSARFSHRGFGVASVLYLLVLIGISSAILFSGYSQTLRGNLVAMRSLSVKNDIEAANVTFAAISVLSEDGSKLCPPGFSYDISSAFEGCPPAADDPALEVSEVPTPIGLSLLSEAEASLLPQPPEGHPDLLAYLKNGAAVDVGVLAAGVGAKQLDPWGHYYIVCRWVNSLTQDSGIAPAFQIISAGPSGVVETQCGGASFQNNYASVMNVASAVNRASVWQVTAQTDDTTTAQFSASGVSVDSNGNLTVPGDIELSGGADRQVTWKNIDLYINSGGISATTGSFSGGISAYSMSAFNMSASTITAPIITTPLITTDGDPLVVRINDTQVLSTNTDGITVAGQAVVDVLKAETTEIEGVLSAGDTTVDTLTAGTTSVGALTASSAGISGAVSAGSLGAASATIQTGSVGTLTVENLVVTGSSSGVVSENFPNLSSATGQLNLETQITGTLPIENGGTNATSASAALSNLGGNNASNITTGTLGYARLDTTGIATNGGPFNRVYVDIYGRVTSAEYVSDVPSGDQISDEDGDSITLASNTITITINDVVKGLWTSSGFTIGSSSLPRAVLDVGYDTSSVVVPVGATDDRPVPPALGMFRYNTTLNAFEGYMGEAPAWKTFTAGGAINGSFNGVCGSDHGQELTHAPAQGTMCLSGVVGALEGTGNPSWEWTCAGIGSGTTASCSATAAVIDAVCGSDSGAVLSEVPTNLCSEGTATTVTDNYNQWTWGCYGGGGGSSRSCYAYPNGVCGASANNVSLSEPPTQANGCDSGLFGNLTTTTTSYTQWTWTCYGGVGGSNAACSAVLIANGTCGTANGEIVTEAPIGTAACNSGEAGVISGTPGTTKIYWNCNPIGVGSVENCSANAPVAAFAFTTQTAVPLNTEITSNAVTLGPAGGFTDLTASCGPGCTDIILNGVDLGNTTATGVKAGDTIAIKQMSDAANMSTSTATVTVGATTGSFSVRTIALSDAFAFAEQTGVSLTSVATATAVPAPTWAGTDDMTAVVSNCTGTNCQVSCNGGGFAASCVLASGQALSVRQTVSAAYGAETLATVTVGGGTSASFRATTVRTANAFGFTAQTGVALGTVATSSATPTWTGGGTLTASISSCTGTACGVSCDGGAYAPSCTLASGQTVSVRQTTAGSFGTETVANVMVGSTTAAFRATTVNTAQAFGFAAQTGVALTAVATSSATPTWTGGGTLTASLASCTGTACGVSCDGGDYAESCTLTSGQTLAVRQTSAGAYGSETLANVTVGTTSASFSATTVNTADPFSFSTQTGQPVSTVVTSNSVTPTWTGGGVLEAGVSSCTGTDCQVSCNGGGYAASCSLASGQSLTVRQTTSASSYTTTVANVSLGTTSTSFTVRTIATAGAFSFTTQTGLALGSVATSETVVPMWSGGETLPVTVANCTGSTCQVSCNGEAYAASCTLSSGQTLSVRQTVSDSYGTTTTATVQVGVTMGGFSVTTVNTSGAFGFDTQTGLTVSTTATSNTVTPTWTGGGTLTATIASCTGTTCGVSCNGGAYAASCSLSSGQSLTARQTTSASSYTTTVANVMVGSTAAAFSVRTLATAGAFSFTTQTGLVLGGTATSETVTPTWDGGETLTAALTSCTGTDCGISCNGGSYVASCTLSSGQSLTVRQTLSGSYGVSAVASVKVGLTAASFTATTINTASAFTITAQTGVALGAVATGTAAPTWTGGGTLTASLTACTGTDCGVSCNGGDYAASCSIASGQTLAVRQTVSGSYGTSTTASVTVGTTAADFIATTVNTAGAFSFASQTGVALGSVITSAAATPTWAGGGTLTATVTSCTGTNCEVSCNGGAYAASCTLSSGQSLTVHQTSGSGLNETTVANVSVGSTAASFSITTVASQTCIKTVTVSLSVTNPFAANVSFSYAMSGGGGGGGGSGYSAIGGGGGGGSSAVIKGGALVAYAAGGSGAGSTTGGSGSRTSGAFTLAAGENLTVYVGGGGGTGWWGGGGGASGYYGGGGGYGGSASGGGGGTTSGGSGYTPGGYLYGGTASRNPGGTNNDYGGKGGNGASGGAAPGGSGCPGGSGGGFGGGGASGGGAGGSSGATSNGIGANAWAAYTSLPAAAGVGGTTTHGGNAGLVILTYASPTGICSL